MKIYWKTKGKSDTTEDSLKCHYVAETNNIVKKRVKKRIQERERRKKRQIKTVLW